MRYSIKYIWNDVPEVKEIITKVVDAALWGITQGDGYDAKKIISDAINDFRKVPRYGLDKIIPL